MQLLRIYSRDVAAALSSVLLLGCGSGHGNDARNASITNRPSAGHQVDPEVAAGVAAWKAAGASDEHQSADGANRDYRAPSNYLKYPDAVRSLIRRADIENDHCRGGLGNDPETYRACNRRDRIMIGLEKKGWCWGGADVGYREHWLRCADDPYYRPGEYGIGPPYSEEEIRELTKSKPK